MMKEYDKTKMIGITEAEKILKSIPYTKTRIIIADTSGPNWFGYSFALIRQNYNKNIKPYEDSDYTWKTVETIMESETVFNPTAKNNIGDMGAYQSVFNRDNFMKVIGEINETRNRKTKPW